VATSASTLISSNGLPGPLTVVVGAEEFLAERAVSSIERAARAADPDTDIRDIRAGDLTLPILDEVLSPSLFGERRVLVVRGLGMGGPATDADPDDDDDAGAAPSGTLDAAVVERLVAHASDDDPIAFIVLVHKDANRGRAQLKALRAVARVAECKKLTGKALAEFTAAELSAAGRSYASDVPAAIQNAVGKDLRELASACSQLATDTPGHGKLTANDVEVFFAGRVEADAFALADAVLEGRTPRALALGRHALAVGSSGPAITAALAFSFRNLVKASTAPHAGRLDEQAAAVGLREWQLRKLRQQLKDWTPDGVARAMRAIAEADAEVKGAAVDSGYAVERLIIRISRARAVR
jgi:DNA polymerase-3 subunit delta